jgi:ABC-type transport system substrate-binding protein
VIERYRDDLMAHPVGTGPYVLKQWRRSSLIALERNPAYRERYFDAEPNADDAEGQALLARFKGRRIPMVDRVELSVIEQSQPRWLAFLNGQIDLIDPVPPDLAKAAVPNTKLAPNLVKQGIHAHTVVNSDVGFTYFNMDDPLVGGLSPEKVALRRAISLAYDVQAEIRLVRNGQAIPAQGPVVPNTYGYDPKLKTINSDFSPARANALLDLYGYKDRDGDGWRETPDGSPLVLEISTQADELQRQLDDQKRKSLGLIGIRSKLRIQQFAENLKAGRAGKLMVWSLASSANSPDGFGGLARVYGPQSGAQNFARFKLPAVDAIYQRMNELPDGPERLGLFNEVVKLVVAYAPYKYHTHRIYVDLTQPWLIGYRRPLFWSEQWQFMDVDMTLRALKLD